MSKTYDVSMRTVVRVTVNDDRVIDRPVNNVDGWRDDLYPLTSRDDVLEHLAFNAIANGYGNATLLDGWADLPADAVRMEIDRNFTTLDYVDEGDS